MTERTTPAWVSTAVLITVIAFIVGLFTLLAVSRSTSPPAPHVDYNGIGG